VPDGQALSPARQQMGKAPPSTLRGKGLIESHQLIIAGLPLHRHVSMQEVFPIAELGGQCLWMSRLAGTFPALIQAKIQVFGGTR
jgi:hypothetical protein